MKIYIKGKKPFKLEQKYFKASGGEGTIYCRGDTAYKIYSDPKKMIPAAKIDQLREIRLDNVLTPLEVIYDSHDDSPAGFTMKYIRETRFLCKLITTSFQQRNGITPEMSVDLVTKLQKTLTAIHKKGILVVDFNEMNFLTDKNFKIPYFIDTNSYQTRDFPATALMESVRDRNSPAGKFSEGTDWFSFAVVAFQLYLGCHPYKGKHPDYTPKQRASLKMMDDGISLFHDHVSLPAGARDWSMVPPGHLDWMRRVFLHGERCAPPYAAGTVTLAVPRIISASENDAFIIEKAAEYNETITGAVWHNGIRYAATEKGLYAGSNLLLDGNFRGLHTEILFADDGTPVLAAFDPEKNEATFTASDGTLQNRMQAHGLTSCNHTAYTVSGSSLLEHSFNSMKKILQGTSKACEIFEPSFEVFPGVAVQNIIGRCWLAIPWRTGACANIHIPELDGHRIIYAAFEPAPGGGICLLFSEYDGTYHRSVIIFSDRCSVYSIRIDSNRSPDTINFTVLNNGLAVAAVSDGSLEAFYDNKTVKVMEDAPVDSSMKLVTDGTGVYFLKENVLYRLKMKK